MKKENKSLYPFIGKEIKNIRRFSNITQEELSNISGVNKDTIRKIENGYTDANVVTLMLLLESLKIDINDFSKIFSNSKGSTISNIKTIYNSIEESLLVYDYKKIQKLLNKVSEIDYSFLPDSTFKEVKSKYLLYNSFVETSLNENYSGSLDLAFQAIDVYINNFSLGKIDNYKYNDLQKRILMNIAGINNQIDIEKSNDIYSSLISINKADRINKYLVYNYINTKFVLGNYEEALKLNEQLIKSLKNHDIRFYTLVLFQKGLILQKLGRNELAYESFEFSLQLSLFSSNYKLNSKIKSIIQDLN
ncbi:MAG: helix-turn-helix domain-containing protein [Anaerococcus sp.]|uniref:helix-turn-helix domain-containing protein n=1 Tax=Anaerococcus sp. TaxID=1872515 RepID=UPI00260B2799|nr:helix-turn-helix transcriptional regulator [Anaerococcus sp.]MCI5971687.1 helix-turn-helix domain-containing protein [Anaerococcus sp.]MDD6918307.1 helix-turn-helix transcriptional regulator [Peptoniphilaceae bacterium]MDY2927789.1 helix-turn-helix transcriptional regulator [Anaerococcus sp.]